MLKYFRGMRLGKGGLHVEETGANIVLNRAFFLGLWKVTIFNIYIYGVQLLRRVHGKRPYGSIAFAPRPGGFWFNAWMAAKLAGYRIVSDPDRADFIFVFDDSTHSDAGHVLSEKYCGRIINHAVSDISKSRVGEVFASIFRYDIRIDPGEYAGQAVQKSDKNGTHDGVIIHCPLKPEEIRKGSAYQKLVDTVYDGQRSEDLRVAFAFGKIPVVFHKFKDKCKRFGMEYLLVDIREADDVFSPAEQEHILAFCQVIGLDFGAIDILRDRHDGRIYIVDVNKTCMPVLTLGFHDQKLAFSKIARDFKDGLAAMGRDSG